MYGEFASTWDYHREFTVIHFGNPEAIVEIETDKLGDDNPLIEPKKKKKPRFLKQPKGWFRT